MDGSLAENATTLAFRYALENEQRIRKMLVRAARGNKQLADEMFSDVALKRLPRLFEMYDGMRPVENYMLNNIRWYAFKYMNERHRKYEPITIDIETEDRYEFCDVLDQLTELDRYFIEAHILWGMPFIDIAIAIRWPVAKVSKAVKAAKQRVAELYGDLQKDTYDDNPDWRFVKNVVKILIRPIAENDG